MIIGSILTQNTTWPSVEQALNNLNKLVDFDPLSILEFANNNEEPFKNAIRCVGFVNQKKQNILKIYLTFILI